MDTKTRIMQGALKLFLQKSYKDVTMHEILNSLELSKGGFYYFFKSKKQLFMEIVDRYFSCTIIFDFEKYPSGSLEQFYKAHIKDLEDTISKLMKDIGSLDDNKSMSINYLYTLFDSMRILPNFQKRVKRSRQVEIECWTQAAENARLSGEISSGMNSEDIARIFIYTGNSIGLELILAKEPMELMTERYRKLWGNLYRDLNS